MSPSSPPFPPSKLRPPGSQRPPKQGLEITPKQDTGRFIPCCPPYPQSEAPPVLSFPPLLTAPLTLPPFPPAMLSCPHMVQAHVPASLCATIFPHSPRDISSLPTV